MNGVIVKAIAKFEQSMASFNDPFAADQTLSLLQKAQHENGLSKREPTQKRNKKLKKVLKSSLFISTES